MNRQITDISGWFPQDVVWDPLVTIASPSNDLISLSMVADSESRVHVLWSQTRNPDTTVPDSALYYFRQEEKKLWSQPVAVVNSSNESVDEPTIALSPDGELLAAWQMSPGQIFFSQVAANLAVASANWSDPKQLSSSSQIANSPDLLVDQEAKIFVAYAVPANEGRGIYLTYSEDHGRTWSKPALIFDAAAAGWEMVDQPQLAITDNGTIHIIWKRFTLESGSPVSKSLLYASSKDGGNNWSLVRRDHQQTN